MTRASIKKMDEEIESIGQDVELKKAQIRISKIDEILKSLSIQGAMNWNKVSEEIGNIIATFRDIKNPSKELGALIRDLHEWQIKSVDLGVQGAQKAFKSITNKFLDALGKGAVNFLGLGE